MSMPKQRLQNRALQLGLETAINAPAAFVLATAAFVLASSEAQSDAATARFPDKSRVWDWVPRI
jgi:hypothetical protein